MFSHYLYHKGSLYFKNIISKTDAKQPDLFDVQAGLISLLLLKIAL